MCGSHSFDFSISFFSSAFSAASLAVCSYGLLFEYDVACSQILRVIYTLVTNSVTNHIDKNPLMQQ